MDSSSENMDSGDEDFGRLLFYRKDGAHSLPYPLAEGQITVGSSSDADVRLKISDDCLEKIHCIVDVNENGIATIINKSVKAPIKVNGISVRKYKVLDDKDIIDIVGKKCQYLNENISNEEMKKEAVAKKVLTPSSNRRRTVAPQVQASAKNSPNLRTKTPVKIQKISLKRKSEGAGSEHSSLVTPEKRLDQRSLCEKSKTTSKLVVSKALGANAKTTKRRLSLGNGPRKPGNININSRVSARNIQFNKSTVTSMITEEEEKPSLSMKQISTPVNKKLETVKSSLRQSLRKSLNSGNDLMSFDSPRKSILKNTPKKSELGIVDSTSDLLTKTVSFSNLKVEENDKDKEKSLYKRNPKNSSGILCSDETEYLRLSSSSFSPLESYSSQDSLFFSSDTESPKKSISRLSLRKSMENQPEILSSRKSRLSSAMSSIVENPSKTISSRNSINTPKENKGALTSENRFNSEDINKTDSSDESINLQLSNSSSSSEPQSTGGIREPTETPSINIPVPKQSDSITGRVSAGRVSGRRSIKSQNNKLSSSNSSQEGDIPAQRCDDAEKDDSAEEPLSPIHPVTRRSSTQKKTNLKSPSEETGYNQKAPVRKSYKSIEQDEEDELLNNSEDDQCFKSELESSFEYSRKEEESLTAEELPSLSIRRSSVRKSYTVQTFLSTRRSSPKNPDDFSSQGDSVTGGTRTSLRTTNISLEDVDESAAKSRKSSFCNLGGLSSPFKGALPQLDNDTPSYYEDNNKSASRSEKNRSLRNSINSSISQIQNASTSSLDSETPETSRRPSLRNSSRRSLVENIENESKTSIIANRKSFSASSNENLTPELETTSSVEKSHSKRNSSSIKHSQSLDSEFPEDLISTLSDVSELESRPSKNRKSFGRLQQDLTLPLAVTTPVPRNRSSVRGRKSLVDDIHTDLTLPLDHELPDPENGSSRKSRKSSLGNIYQEQMLTLEGKTPVPRNRSLRKSRISQVDDLQEDLTLPTGYDMPESTNESSRKSSTHDFHENSTLPMETPEPRNRFSIKSRKSSVNDLYEDSTLPMEDETPDSKNDFSSKSRISLGSLQNDSSLLLGQSSVPRNRSSIKSSVYPESKNESFRKSRKSAPGSLHNESTLPLEEERPLPRDRFSVKSRKSSDRYILEGSTLPVVGQTPIPRNRSSVNQRKSSVNSLHENLTLPLESQPDLTVTLDNKTPELSRSSVKIRNSSIPHFSEGTPQPLESGTPVPSRRSSRTPKPSLKYSMNHTNQSMANQSNKSVVCLETSISSMKSRNFSVSDNEESLAALTPEKSVTDKLEMSSVGRLSSIGRLPKNSGYSVDRSSVNVKTPVPYHRSVRRSSKLEESFTISVAHSTLNEDHSSLSEVFSIEESRAETPEPSRRSSARRYKFENSINSDDSDATQELSESRTPEASRRSSRRTNKSSEDLYSDESRLSMRSETPEVRSSTTKEDVLSLANTLDSTPENNTSIVFIDAPLDESRKPGHLRLSKTIHSKIEEVDLTTPKSAIKSRRRKSLPYQPETENITPVSPLDRNKSETGFKTPLTTPGLFEDIRKSVLKSRSRMQKSSSNLMEELSKAESNTKNSKRPRESDGDSARQHKRRRVVINEDDSFSYESFNGSFESFESDEALTDISASNLPPDTPSYLSDLTDKPVITHPRTRFSTGEKSEKRKSTRRSLSVSTMMVINSGSNTADEENVEECLNESSEEVKWVQKSPENDLTNVAGVKRLMKTPKVQNSPKNDLSDVRGTKKLCTTPKVMKSPKNELIDVAGVKRLLATPKEVKPPKNDLTNIFGVKKLLATPKEMKSPKNDLTNIPNLRRIMSPKYQNSPANDLSDLRGVKKLLSTPKESKGPLNELSDLEGVADIFNISGVHRLSNTSDIENNEDLFGELVFRKPLKTYRGKSLSPNRKIDSYGAKRKTMGDKSDMSPRVEDWVKDQAVIRIERMDDLGAGDEMSEPDLEKEVEELSTRIKKKTRVQEIKEEIGIASPPRRGGRRKAVAEEESESSKATTKTRNKVEDSSPAESPVRKATRGRSKKVVKEIGVQNGSTEFTKEVESSADSDGMEVNSPRTRGRRKAVVVEEKPTRGGRKVANRSENPEETEEVEKPVVTKTTRGKNKNIDEEKSEVIPVASVGSPKTTRGRKKVGDSPVAERTTRGKRKLVQEKSEESETDGNEPDKEPKNVGGKSKLNIDEEQSSEVTVSLVDSPVKSRGRRKLVVEVLVEEKINKRRKKTSEEPENAPEKSNKSDEVFAESPKRPTRGGRNAKVMEEDIVEKPTRGRRKVEVIEPVQSRRTKKTVRGKGKTIDESSDDVCESSETMEIKKPVSKKNNKDIHLLEEPDLSSGSEESDTYDVSKKNTRGTKNVPKKLQGVSAESPKSTRGRRKVMEVVGSTIDKPEESSKKTRKGRNIKTIQIDDSESLVSKTDIKKPQSKSGKIGKIEEEISSAQVDSTTGDFFPIPSEDSKEENVPKPVKGRKTRKNIEIESVEPADEKPVSKRTKRGRKVSSDEALNAMETRTETEEVEEKKITKAKSKKVPTKTDLIEDIEKKPTRGGRQTRGRKLTEEEDIEPVKVTRGRKQKESEVVKEEPTKKIEEVEETSTRNIRKTGRLAKNKAIVEETSSPNTRPVKGNFNKYGSSFETESPKKAVGKRRRVHFD